MRSAVWARPVSGWEVVLSTGNETDHTDRFLALVADQLDRAYRLAGLFLGSRAEAEDATQEAYLRAWRRIATLRDPDGMQAWFDRILTNVCLDRLRRRTRVRFIALDEGVASMPTGDPFRAVLDRDEVLRAVAVLADDERLVVILHYWADLTLEAIAQRVGWPLGTVKSRLHRALLRLSETIERDEAAAVARHS
jgi:RNA polymerase sigma-70 factor (ECF subfamily)